MKAVADNDILLKAASYGLLRALVVDYVGKGQATGHLGAARFMLPKVLLKTPLNGDREAAVSALLAWFDTSEGIEPNEDELAAAARLERAAQKLGVPLHGGESQLCAVVIARAVHQMLTGDKQAIGAIHALIDDDPSLATLTGRVHCLEIIVEVAVGRNGLDAIRSAVCSEPGVDKTLSIVFSCSSPDATSTNVMAGLQSYISDLKRKAARVFVET